MELKAIIQNDAWNALFLFLIEESKQSLAKNYLAKPYSAWRKI